MNIFGIGIFLSLVIHDSSQGLIGGLYWTAMKTDNLQANVLSYSSCMAKGGNFPQFDLNTREGRKLNMIRMSMDNLAKCTVLNIVVCGPKNHINACYQLMLLLIQKPYLIAYLAASPFSCAMKLICQVWPNNPKMRCENGLPVAPPSISHANMLPHLGLRNHFRPHTPDLIPNPNPCIPQQGSGCGYPNEPSNFGPPLNPNMYPSGPMNYGPNGNNYQSLQPSPSFDSDPYNSNPKPPEGEGNKKNSFISSLFHPLRKWKTTQKSPSQLDSEFGLNGNHQPSQSSLFQIPGTTNTNPYNSGPNDSGIGSNINDQHHSNLFHPQQSKTGQNGNNQPFQSTFFQTPGTANSNPYNSGQQTSGPFNSEFGLDGNNQAFQPGLFQTPGTGYSNLFNSGTYDSGFGSNNKNQQHLNQFQAPGSSSYNPYDELNKDDQHPNPSNLLPTPASHSNDYSSNPYGSGFGQNKDNVLPKSQPPSFPDHKKTPDPYDELLGMNVEDQQKFPSLLSIVTHQQSTGANQGNAGINGNAQQSYPPIGSMSDPYKKQGSMTPSINSHGYPQGPYDMEFGPNDNAKQPLFSNSPGVNSSYGNHGLNSFSSNNDHFDSGNPYEPTKPGKTASKFSMDSEEDYHASVENNQLKPPSFGLEFGKEFNTSMGIQI